MANILIRQYWWLPGLGCNAAATIANGGFMPVFDMEATGGMHIQGTPDAALQFLCDQYWGASIGDFFLIVAFIFYSGQWAIQRTRKYA